VTRVWLTIASWLGIIDLRRYQRMEEVEEASLKRAERIRTGDFLDDVTTLGGD
jgi:hypothetical protein